MAYEALFEAFVRIQNNEWTKDTLAEIPTCKGVLLFTDSTGRPIQLLQAAGCRRTAQAKLLHEETESPARKADVSTLATTIYYTCCHNNFLTQQTYTQLAHEVFGKDVNNWIQLPKVSLAAIDTDAFLPYFYVSDAIGRQTSRHCFGLFPTRKAVADFCELLNTAFVLCRNPALLKTGREQSCPYLQMQTCPGPCLNADLRQDYANTVKQAVETAAGNLEQEQQQAQQQMLQCSKQMDFENAQRCKKKLDLLNKLSRPDLQHVHRLKDVCFLHIDAGPKEKPEGAKRKIQQLMWFKVTAEKTHYLGNCVPETEDDIKQFIETNWAAEQNPLPCRSAAEHLAILSLQLFRSNRPGHWIDCTNGIWLDKITAALNQNKPQHPCA